IKFQTYYYSFQKLNFPFHQRNSFKSVSSVVKKRTISVVKKRTIKEIFTLVIKNPLVSSAFNVQISGLQLKIIRATLNYIKDNRGSSVSSVVKKTTIKEVVTLVIKEIYDLRHLRLIIKFKTNYYSFQKLNILFHQRYSFIFVSYDVKNKL